MMAAYVLGGLVLFGLLAFIAWRITRISPAGGDAEKDELVRSCAELKATLAKKTEEVGVLKAAVESEKAEKSELAGKSKQLFAEYTKAEAKLDGAAKEITALKKQLATYEESDARREKEFEQRLSKLEAAKVSLEEERQRVIREDEERRAQAEEERDRLWAEHEIGVIASLTDLCKDPELSFTSYTNTNLPDGFDGSLKPDFLIDFLGQYVIFDAKVSKAKSLKAYIDDQVKKTVSKVKDNNKIYPWIFLVVPTAALPELKNHHFVIDGFHLFIVSPEALPAILRSLKRITHYELAEGIDPQQRENIVQLIAELDFHINLRNAADILLSKMGTDLLDKAQRVDPALAEEVALKKQPMNAKASLAASEIKKIVAKLTTQNEEIHRLVSPKASIKKKDLDAAKDLFSQTLL